MTGERGYAHPVRRLLALGLLAPLAAAQTAEPFGIRVVDGSTGRGVPLVSLRTTGDVVYVTDSAGWVAFDEPGLLGERVWFHVESHGYALPADGFGYAGVALDTTPGGRARIEVERVNVAERLYRVTGQGTYRDTILLGEDAPLALPLLNGGVTGQDSVVTAVLSDRVLWFWGDTNRAAYPLGLFSTAGARSSPPAALDASVGIELDYFTGDHGFARAMCPIDGPGPVWIDGLMVLEGGELVARYVRVESLGVLHEQGLARWNAEREVFEKWRELALDEELHPASHPVLVEDGGRRYYVFPFPYPDVRVPATLDAIGDPGSYEALTCLVPGEVWGGGGARRARRGRPRGLGLEARHRARRSGARGGARPPRRAAPGRGARPPARRRDRRARPRAQRERALEPLARTLGLAARRGRRQLLPRRGLVRGGRYAHGAVARRAEGRHARRLLLLQRRRSTSSSPRTAGGACTSRARTRARSPGPPCRRHATTTTRSCTASTSTTRASRSPSWCTSGERASRGPLEALRAAGLDPADAEPVCLARTGEEQPLPDVHTVLGREAPVAP